MRIIGSGMAGLLAANALRRFGPTIEEAQPSLPNNHAALLRFRTDAVSRVTGIPFRKVTVHKALVFNNTMLTTSNLALNNMYSLKVTGKVADRSIINLTAGERFIAPDNFIAQMAASVVAKFGMELRSLEGRDENSEPLISTMPMPKMMDMAGWKDKPEFRWHNVWALTCRVEGCEVFQTIYYPDPDVPCYRASLTGNLLTVECLKAPFSEKGMVEQVLKDFGISQTVSNVMVKEQKYGKLVPLEDSSIARKFILFMTDRYRVYSLGRFAIWKQVLLDDVVHDISVIERLIEYRGQYNERILK